MMCIISAFCYFVTHLAKGCVRGFPLDRHVLLCPSASCDTVAFGNARGKNHAPCGGKIGREGVFFDVTEQSVSAVFCIRLLARKSLGKGPRRVCGVSEILLLGDTEKAARNSRDARRRMCDRLGIHADARMRLQEYGTGNQRVGMRNAEIHVVAPPKKGTSRLIPFDWGMGKSCGGQHIPKQADALLALQCARGTPPADREASVLKQQHAQSVFSFRMQLRQIRLSSNSTLSSSLPQKRQAG